MPGTSVCFNQRLVKGYPMIPMLSYKIRFQFIIFSVIAMTGTSAFAQTKAIEDDDRNAEKSEVRAGLQYVTDYYFMGRNDSAKAPFLTPYIGYYHKSGFSLRGALSYMTAKDEGRIDLYSFAGGYDYYGKKTAAGIAFREYIFSDESFAIQAEMNSYLSAYVGYDFNAVVLYTDVAMGLSDETDFFWSTEVNKTIYALHNRIAFKPAVYLNAGTQNYYMAYYTNRSQQTGLGKKGKGYGQPGSSSQAIAVLQSDQFQLLDYEAELQVSYKIDRLLFYVTSTWIFPLNPSTLLNEQGQLVEEELNNGWYGAVGMQIKF